MLIIIICTSVALIFILSTFRMVMFSAVTTLTSVAQYSATRLRPIFLREAAAWNVHVSKMGFS